MNEVNENEQVENQTIVDESNQGDVFTVGENFGILIKFYRVKVKDLTLRQLAELTQISTSYLSRLENSDKCCPSLPVVLRLADVLNIPLAILLETASQQSEMNEELSLFDVLIQNNYSIDNQIASKEMKMMLVKITQYIIGCEWNSHSKVKELYLLSKMIDEIKLQF